MSLSTGVKTRFLLRAEECCICSLPISVQGLLDSCKHVFCLVCILKWGDIENTCPICKQRFTTVTPKRHRKCLAVRRYEERTCYYIERRSQRDADMGFRWEENADRAGAQWRPNLLTYLEDLISEIRR